MTFRLRVRDEATGYGNYYAKHRGEHLGWFDDRQTAEDVKRAMPNGESFDVVEVKG